MNVAYTEGRLVFAGLGVVGFVDLREFTDVFEIRQDEKQRGAADRARGKMIARDGALKRRLKQGKEMGRLVDSLLE